MFESFVNSEEYQTIRKSMESILRFESFVNSEEYQTSYVSCWICNRFESFVNSEEYQTAAQAKEQEIGLRALLIQKSIKLEQVEYICNA